jgi:hypothetical protein
MVMTLKKLTDLFEEAKEISLRLFNETGYTFYRSLEIGLRSMQQNLDTQWLIEDREKRESD